MTPSNSCRDLAWQLLRFSAFNLPGVAGAHFSRRAAARRGASRHDRNEAFNSVELSRMENIIGTKTIFCKQTKRHRKLEDCSVF